MFTKKREVAQLNPQWVDPHRRDILTQATLGVLGLLQLFLPTKHQLKLLGCSDAHRTQ